MNLTCLRIIITLSLASLFAGCASLKIPEYSQTHSIYTPTAPVEIPAHIVKQLKTIERQELKIDAIKNSLEEAALSDAERTKIKGDLLRKKLILESLEYQLKLDEENAGLITP